MSNFKKEITNLINRYSKENGSDTPDYILADYLVSCLETFDKAISARDSWYGKTITPRINTEGLPKSTCPVSQCHGREDLDSRFAG